MNQEDEEKQWNLYCAVIANPQSDAGSFEEFKQIFSNQSHACMKDELTTSTMNAVQIELQVEKASGILNSFVPPLEGGV